MNDFLHKPVSWVPRDTPDTLYIAQSFVIPPSSAGATEIVYPTTATIVTTVYGYASPTINDVALDRGKGVCVDNVLSKAQKLWVVPRWNDIPLVIHGPSEHEVVVGNDFDDGAMPEPLPPSQVPNDVWASTSAIRIPPLMPPYVEKLSTMTLTRMMTTAFQLGQEHLCRKVPFLNKHLVGTFGSQSLICISTWLNDLGLYSRCGV